jgi:hypothetical protein
MNTKVVAREWLILVSALVVGIALWAWIVRHERAGTLKNPKYELTLLNGQKYVVEAGGPTCADMVSIMFIEGTSKEDIIGTLKVFEAKRQPPNSDNDRLLYALLGGGGGRKWLGALLLTLAPYAGVQLVRSIVAALRTIRKR